MTMPREFWISTSEHGDNYIFQAYCDGCIHVREVMPAEVNEDLEAAASKHAKIYWLGSNEADIHIFEFKAGAEWQKAKDAKEIEDRESIRRSRHYSAGYVRASAKVREETIREVIKYLKVEQTQVYEKFKDKIETELSPTAWACIIESKFLPKESG